MNPQLQDYLHQLEQDISGITTKRKEKLGSIADFIAARHHHKNPARCIFICTHNSRRSHLCQIWAATLADHFGLQGIETFSGGTEVTAFNPRAVAAIERAGFDVADPGGKNPRYKVYHDKQKKPLICYSKRFDDTANPVDSFAAIMTCSHADQNCPIVPGADFRITIPYEDPKKADGTPHETETYDTRCRQIAAEMYYMLFQLK